MREFADMRNNLQAKVGADRFGRSPLPGETFRDVFRLKSHEFLLICLAAVNGQPNRITINVRQCINRPLDFHRRSFHESLATRRARQLDRTRWRDFRRFSAGDVCGKRQLDRGYGQDECQSDEHVLPFHLFFLLGFGLGM